MYDCFVCIVKHMLLSDPHQHVIDCEISCVAPLAQFHLLLDGNVTTYQISTTICEKLRGFV